VDDRNDALMEKAETPGADDLDERERAGFNAERRGVSVILWLPLSEAPCGRGPVGSTTLERDMSLSLDIEVLDLARRLASTAEDVQEDAVL
jgi:hypothetical protein